jgi:signal transduction histidine kinase
VRNPLSSIGLNAELLVDELAKLLGGAAAEGTQLIAAIQKEVDRLTGITEEYLRFARLPRPRLEKEQVNDIAAQLCEFSREELAQRGISVEATLDPLLPPVRGDEGQLRQALLNLLRNAAEAMAGQGGGKVRLETRNAGERVEIRVADAGPGIPAQDLPRIFEPFFSTKEGGTGLGLALVQQIVVEHGGKLQVESGASGTTFVIDLPAAS